MMIPDDLDVPQDDAQAMWRERERRQRSVRFMMMFLLMLLLMDGEEQSQRRRHEGRSQLRGGKHSSGSSIRNQGIDPDIYERRQQQDKLLVTTMKNHPRYQKLIKKNGGNDVDSEVRAWAEQQLDLQKDEFEVEHVGENTDPAEHQKVFHYPWNATGFYRGEWARDEPTESDNSLIQGVKTTDQQGESKAEITTTKNLPEEPAMDSIQLEAPMKEILTQRKESLDVLLLPPGMRIKLPNATIPAEKSEVRSKKKQHPLFLRGPSETNKSEREQSVGLRITLTKPSGRVAFQLYEHSVPATKEFSLLDGFVKLYDSNSVGYSTRRDILLRVTGVIFHSTGKISLVSNSNPGRSALVIDGDGANGTENRRKLFQEISSSVNLENEIETRQRAINLFTTDPDRFSRSGKMISATQEGGGMEMHDHAEAKELLHRRLAEDIGEDAENENELSKSDEEITVETDANESYHPAYVFPYPYAIDDKEQQLERMRKNNPATRSMPPREQLLEANAGRCEFEIDMEIVEEEWELAAWRQLVGRHMKEDALLDPSRPKDDPTVEKGENQRRAEDNIKIHDGSKKKMAGSKSSSKNTQDQALVMVMNGTIRSENCNFSSHVNVTAIRTDWEKSSTKAINYSFYMMLTCLTQIVLLLRQLLHTQTQSAATKVSLLCIGWQTVLDALLCLVHIYLSLAMQPLFTAFASVAFFKLLIFCVIEMKYMAIILQSRNANNGGNTIELLRRQIAMLHLRFYVALIGCFLLFFYVWESYQTIYVLALYSFWVPQIIQNIVTEAKRPLHPYYIHGMSFTRLIAPLYIFAVKNNFLKEVYPDSQTNVFMCELLIIWVGIQSACLEAQGRYGARFMIPARFLPPKFDYSRPIPDSLLPTGSQDMTPSESLRNERGAPSEIRPVIASDKSPLRANGGARNRIKGSRATRAESSMTTETCTAPANPPSPSFDCVICYSSIDIRNRRGYMLAPCDHLFHRECLEQWMEVKLECPICRENLPSL